MSNTNLAIEYYSQATDLLHQYDENKDPKKLEKAMKLYELAIKHNPNLPDAYIGLAAVTIRRGKVREDIERAIELSMKALELNPCYPYAHLSLGRCYSLMGDLESAISEMEIAINYYPDFATAHYDIGRLYLKVGNTSKAQEHLKKATLSEFPSIASSAKSLLEEISKTMEES